MPSASLKHPKEHFDSLMRRFKKNVEKSEILKDLRDREFFEKPSMKKKRAKAAAKKRAQRENENRQLKTKRPY